MAHDVRSQKPKAFANLNQTVRRHILSTPLAIMPVTRLEIIQQNYVPQSFFSSDIQCSVYMCYRETLLRNEAIFPVCDVCIDRGGVQFEHFQLLIVTLC